MNWFPDLPEVPKEQRGGGQAALRYEDVSQDGRLMLLGLPHTIGDVIWRGLIAHHPLVAASHRGIIPILHRFVIEGGEGPVSVRVPLTGDGRFQLAHTVGGDGAVDRLMINMWVDLTAPRGRVNGPPPPGAGEMIFVGRVFAEHVLTRLFAPPAERKVVRLDVPGVTPLPPDRWTWRAPEEVLALPPGTLLLDENPVADVAPMVFGLNHTDSNQHVNSLIHPRLFQDAALRRFAAHGRATTVLARRLEIAYRKPCFAGDRVRVILRAFTDGEQLGAVGSIVSDDQQDARPYCTVQMLFGK